MTISEENKKPQKSKLKIRTILITASWFGLITGLVEGTALFTNRQLTEYRWNHSMIDVGPKCLWIAPLVNVVLFCLLGIFFWLMLSKLKWRGSLTVTILGFTFLTILNWLGILLGTKVAPYALVLLTAGIVACCKQILLCRINIAIAFWRRSLSYVVVITILVLITTEMTIWLTERSATSQLISDPNLPNILVIVADTLRADRLSCYGCERSTSPNIDRLAEEGILFSAAFSTSSWTPPSHASILTGLYPTQHGVEWKTYFALLWNKLPVLPEVLLNYGYRTGAFSANTFWFTRSRGFGRGFIRFEDYYQSQWDMILRTVYGRLIKHLVLPRLGFENIPARKSATNVNDAFLAWINEDPKRPFFGFLNYIDTHDPYLPPEPFRSRFSKSHSPGGLINAVVMHRDSPELTSEELQSEIDAYDGAVAYVDDQIGRLLQELEIRDLKDRTLIIFTSDHGESFGEHGLLLHGNSLYLDQIHVPLIIRLPESIPTNFRYDSVVSNASIPVTVMDILGFHKENIFPGVSLVESCKDVSMEAGIQSGINPFILAEVEHQMWTPKVWPVNRGSMKAIMTETYHLIFHDTEPEELYMWRVDPAENKNLMGTPQGAEMATRMRGIFEQTTRLGGRLKIE